MVFPKENPLLLQKYWFYVANSISEWCLMLFWTKKISIDNNQVFIKITPVLIHEVRSPIKHTQHLAQCLGNRKILIGYGSSEAEDELKLLDNKCTRSTSQRKTEQTQE